MSDISLIKSFKKIVLTNLDDMLLSVIEQHNSEIGKLNNVILTSTELIKEKEMLIRELKAEIDNKDFEENNYNNVSLIQNLTKQVDQLTNENNLLTTSLNVRKEQDKQKYKNNNTLEDVNDNKVIVKDNTLEDVKDNMDEEVKDNMEEELKDNNEEEVKDNKEEVKDNMEEEVKDNKEEVKDNMEEEVNDNMEEEVKDNMEEEEKEDDNMTDEEIELEEIEYKNKKYYLKDNIIYNKKKNSDMGKEVGKLVDGMIKLNRKKKDKKKDKVSN